MIARNDTFTTTFTLKEVRHSSSKMSRPARHGHQLANFHKCGQFKTSLAIHEILWPVGQFLAS